MRIIKNFYALYMVSPRRKNSCKRLLLNVKKRLPTKKNQN